MTPEDLVYAATSRCTCGAGLAYQKGCGTNGCWECADVLLEKSAYDDKDTHIAPLPFIFYEVKSEDQPSQEGRTTRPE